MIDVLLATYRPDPAFLKAQVDSIRGQTSVEVNLICREDRAGEGPKANFSILLQLSKAAYVAFSDQDDVWFKDKLDRCLAQLVELERRYGEDTPALVFCDAVVTDGELRPYPGTMVHNQKVDVEAGLQLNRLLVHGFLPGTAMVFNAALRRKAGTVPPKAIMHDIWIALVAAAYGHVEFVDAPLYYYRQHGDNVSGATRYNAAHIVRRCLGGPAQFRKRLAQNVEQAQAFVDRFGEESPACVRALARFPRLGWLGKRKALFRFGLWKHGFFRKLAMSFWA